MKARAERESWRRGGAKFILDSGKFVKEKEKEERRRKEEKEEAKRNKKRCRERSKNRPGWAWSAVPGTCNQFVWTNLLSDSGPGTLKEP